MHFLNIQFATSQRGYMKHFQDRLNALEGSGFPLRFNLTLDDNNPSNHILPYTVYSASPADPTQFLETDTALNRLISRLEQQHPKHFHIIVRNEYEQHSLITVIEQIYGETVAHFVPVRVATPNDVNRLDDEIPCCFYGNEYHFGQAAIFALLELTVQMAIVCGQIKPEQVTKHAPAS